MVGQMTRQRNLPNLLLQGTVPGTGDACGLWTPCPLKAGMAQPCSGEHEAEEKLPSPPLCCHSSDRRSAGRFPRRCCENKVV